MKYKKPTLDIFKQALAATRGNLSATAKALKVSRTAIWEWGKDDKEFKEAIEDTRKAKLDQFISTAELMALGIPDIDPATNKAVGWIVEPDGQMLRYFISRLGRDEGFGENLDVTSNGKDINPVVQVEIIDKRSDVITPEEDTE